MQFKSCTMHYMLEYCICPPGLCYHNEPFGFGGLSLCKKALQAISEYIPQEVKNLHVYMYMCVCQTLWDEKHFCCFCKSEQRTRHWG